MKTHTRSLMRKKGRAAGKSKETVRESTKTQKGNMQKSPQNSIMEEERRRVEETNEKVRR